MRTIYPEYRTQIDVYTAGQYTWTATTGAAFIHVTCIGAGGGGGSGARYPAGTHRNGGQGGQGGAYNTAFLPAALVADTVSVMVGSSGPGGFAVDYDYGDGDPGVAGGWTSFGEYVLAVGGNGGAGGTNAPFNVADMPHNYEQIQSLYARSFGGVNGEKAEGAAGCPGGGSGGYITAADAPNLGGLGSRSYVTGRVTGLSDIMPGEAGPDSTGLIPGPGSSAGGGSPPGAALDPDAVDPENWPLDGGRGGRYGAGGGGGAANTNGAASGTGGAGAHGVCLVVTFF